MDDLERRVRVIEDVLAVQHLMANYHNAVDGWDERGTHRDPGAIADLFTEDGVWDVTAREPAPTGREEIAALARDLQAVPWIIHTLVSPIVSAEGDRATGEFKGILRVGRAGGEALRWSMGRYRLDARRTPEGWRIQRLSWEPMTEAQRFNIG